MRSPSKHSNIQTSKHMEYLDFGVPISFGLTLNCLSQKTCTRRDWKDSHAQKYLNALSKAAAENKQLRVPALSKGFHRGGVQIGWVTFTETPYKERLADMPESDLQAEGGTCETVKDFIAKYFKGKANKEVWVVKFEFLAEAAPTEAVSLDVEVQKPLSEPIQFCRATHNIFTSSKSDEHGTPPFLIKAAREVLGTIDLDPMSNPNSQEIVKATTFYTKEEDRLTKPWIGKIWLNPAFSLANEAVAKLIGAYQAGICCEAVLLLKAAPETKRCRALAPYPFCELKQRVKYIGNKDSAQFSTLIFYLGNNFAKFKEVFSNLGNIRLGQNQVNELESDRRELLAQVAELQMQLAKKSEFSGSAGEPDITDWLNHDLTEQIGLAKSRLTELEIDREVLPEDIYIRQRTEWQAKLECWRYTERAIAKIQTRFTPEYEGILSREHPTIETEPGYTSEFAVNQLVESSPETGSLLVKIDQYYHTTAGGIARCKVRISQRVARGSEFLITAEELFKDFHPWAYIKKEILPQYSLGSIRTEKGLKGHFQGLKFPPAPRPDCTEVTASDGSIWQACRDDLSGRAAIKWRCEVLPDGFSRSPRIDDIKKGDCLESIAQQMTFY